MLSKATKLTQEFKIFSKANPSEIKFKSLIKSIFTIKFTAIIIFSIIVGTLLGKCLPYHAKSPDLIIDAILYPSLALFIYPYAIIIAVGLAILTFGKTKQNNLFQGINARLSYITILIGTKYFISIVILMITFIDSICASFFIFAGMKHIVTIIPPLFIVDLGIIGISISVIMCGQLLIDYVRFFSEKCFEVIPLLHD